MNESNRKGDLAEAMVIADVLKRGYQVAKPYGQDWRYDLIVLRNNKMERVQIKIANHQDNAIKVRCRYNTGKGRHAKKYTKEMIDWIAAYDQVNNRCYYVPSSVLEKMGPRASSIRIKDGKFKDF